jgi:AmmeMemoRadiSam system protein A
MSASLKSKPAGPVSPQSEQVLLRVARDAIHAHLVNQALEVPEDPPGLPKTEGLFVTLWDESHDLRGCIGHVGGTSQPVLRDVAEFAVASASRDPRVRSVDLEELDRIRVEISLLHTVEPCPDTATLDPEVYGVVCRQGWRRGVLLPQVDGVHTVEEQLAIACRKGGIDRSQPYEVDRFQVHKVRETGR